jgi:hypothetical protein
VKAAQNALQQLIRPQLSIAIGRVKPTGVAGHFPSLVKD